MYYLWLNDTQSGPFTLGQLKSMWNAGQITAANLFWQEGRENWEPLQEIVNLIEPPQPLPVAPVPRAKTSPPAFDQTAALAQTFQSSIAASAAQASQAADRQLLFEAQKKSAGVACLLNFVLPGVGYMYAGRIIIGIFVLMMWGFFVLLGFFTFGIGALPAALIWFVGIIDGFITVNSANKKLALQMLAR